MSNDHTPPPRFGHHEPPERIGLVWSPDLCDWKVVHHEHLTAREYVHLPEDHTVAVLSPEDREQAAADVAMAQVRMDEKVLDADDLYESCEALLWHARRLAEGGQ